MFHLAYTRKFLKDYRIANKRQFDLELIDEVIKILEQEGSLPSSFRPHKLFGKFADCWECHIRPDWLLIWMKDDENMEITLIRTGTHSDLF